jgi:diguanylate cyclase (GGDEF)-like protein
LGLFFDVLLPAVLWYGFLLAISMYGFYVYKDFSVRHMNEEELEKWYERLKIFMYLIFASWLVVFLIFVGHHRYDLHYIAIFTQIGASVVASVLLVSDKKLFVPILSILMTPLALYFLLIDAWYGYVLSSFSLILLFVLLYAANNTHIMIQKNYYHAQHDALTGLFNRRYFLQYMEALNKELETNNKTAYIFLIDLDHFKTINDSLGHDVGDKLLKEVANRIELYTKGTHMLARLGGDEFMVASRALKNEEAGKVSGYLFAKGLLGVIRKPYLIDSHHLHISASVGGAQA